MDGTSWRSGFGRAAWRIPVLLAAATGLTLGVVPASDAVHFYRGPSGGCTSAAGPLTSTSAQAEPDATVLMLHNTFNDAETGLPVTRIAAGETVEWQWSSAHCHSVGTSTDAFYSGFHYPEAEPESPPLAPGALHYPVPDDSPALGHRHTFATPGTYTYMCVHHAAIGMVGTIIVE